MKSVRKLLARSTTICRAVFLVSILYAGNVSATVYNVTNTTDGNALNQLRGAIVAADAAGPGPHTINVAAGTYTLTLGEITFGNNPQTISIVGAGAATTIISMTTGATKDRIFFINPSGSTNSPVISISGITFQNGSLTSDTYGGGGICAGGGSGESLTVTNCAFINNFIPVLSYGGAAICMQVRGSLTVDNCTFTNNVSNDADGGAILFIPYNSGFGNGQGNLSVTNSTFTGNSVNIPGASNSNGGALAFTGPGGAVFFSVTITNNTFINNTADGFGGAISANNSPNLNIPVINFNRFLGNTAAAGAASNALHFVESAGSVNANNNWWGCNTGPSAGPCDRAGGDVAGGGTLTLTKWLQLKTTASPSTICNSGSNTSTVTTSFLSNSASEVVTAANVSRLNGLPVTWGPTTNGSLSGAQTTIQENGTATATFTSNGTGSVTATINAQVDNVPNSEVSPSRASITVNTASVAPTGATGTTTVCNGGTTTLTVTGGTKGTGASTQWFTGSCGGTLVFTGDAFLTPSLSTNTTYFVRYNGTCNTTTCASVTVTVSPNNTVSLTSAVGTDAQTVNVNTAITNITYGTTVATGATVTGLPAGVTGSWAANVVTISGTPTTTVGSPFNYTVTPTGGCGSVSANGSITVNAVWVGGTSSAWNIPANWSSGVVPSATDNVVLPAVVTNEAIISTAVTTANVTLATGRTITLNAGGSLTVNGILTMGGGNITLGNQNMTFGASATVSGAAATKSIVTSGTGTVSRAIAASNNFQFPIGVDATSYNPLTVALPGGDPTETFSVRAQAGFANLPGSPPPPTSLADVVNRAWVITELTPGGNNATLTFQYNVGEYSNPPFSPGGPLYIARHNGTQWLTTLATATPGPPHTVSASGFTAFSPFGITSNTNSLPVQLASFTGTYVNNNRAVRLNWTTVSEVNNYGFNVQKKRTTESQWSEIENSFIAGHGTTNVPQLYTFTDNAIAARIWQYRLKQVDLDGTVHYTEPILIDTPTDVRELAPIAFALNQNFPNPLNPSTEIKFSVEQTGRATLQVYNMLGQLVATLFDDVVEAGYYQTVRFNGADLASGVYIYRLQSGNKSDLKKLVLLK